jgi:hypothetical protein
VIVAWNLASCQSARKAVTPIPEEEQAISESMKDLYIAVSLAAPQSLKQQKTMLRMTEKASNGKELLLVMRAAEGVFPSAGAARQQEIGSKVHSEVTAKMMELGTLDQLIEYAAQYSIAPDSARPFVQRIFQLANGNSDPRAWYRIRAVASRLKLSDLERQAQARADQLADR